MLVAALFGAAMPVIVRTQVPPPAASSDATELRRWAEHGFPPEVASTWIDTGTGPEEAHQWRDAGIEFAGWAAQWKEQGFAPAEAGLWVRSKVNVYTAGDFRNAGFSIPEAKTWIDHGVRSALRAKEFRDLKFTPEDAGEWWRLKFFPEDAAAWRDEGLRPQGAVAWRYGEQESTYTYRGSKVTSRSLYSVDWARGWKAAGFSPAEARLAGEYDVTLEEATAWREAGFAFEEGIAWKDSGFTPVEAASLRESGLTAPAAEEQKHDLSDTDVITRLHSDIILRPDATLDVTETIVLSNGAIGAVEHCFQRRLPARVLLRRSRGLAVDGWPSYRNVSVLHNGTPQRYSASRARLGDLTLCLGASPGDGHGAAETPLGNGVHTFRIHYRTDDRLIDLHDQDRLFVDVTPPMLDIPVMRASATIYLPRGADTVRADGFAGPPNRQYFVADVTETPDGDQVRYRVTRSLRPEMGFAVAVHLTKGFARATLWQRVRHLDRESGRILSAVLVFGVGLAAALAYLLVAWFRVGRDPERGVVVPVYGPPAAISPALARYLLTGRVDDTSVAATLVRLAQHGALVIREREGFYRIDQAGGRLKGPAAHESAFREALFAARPTLGVGSVSARRRLRSARRALRRALRAESREYVVKNRRYLVPGLVLCVAGVAGAAATIDPDISNDVPAAVLAVMGVAAAALNFAFWWLLKAPTAAARKLLDDIEGFRRFLDASYRTPSTVEGSIVSDLPPAAAVHLPYAIALGLDTERAAVLDRGMDWYAGRSGGFSVGDFTRSLNRRISGETA